jgi:uncharacterized membrane protein
LWGGGDGGCSSGGCPSGGGCRWRLSGALEKENKGKQTPKLLQPGIISVLNNIPLRFIIAIKTSIMVIVIAIGMCSTKFYLIFNLNITQACTLKNFGLNLL